MSEPKRPKRGRISLPPQSASLPQPDERFDQLLDLAREGDGNAIADLFREYGFRFGEDEA